MLRGDGVSVQAISSFLQSFARDFYEGDMIDNLQSGKGEFS